MAEVRLQNLSKKFDETDVLQSLNLHIKDGEFLVLLGPSGCGKSTTLRMIAGLEEPSAGKIFIGDRDVTSLAPKERDLAMVFQSYALYPHLSVRENMAFGLKVRKTPRETIKNEIARVAKLLEIENLLDRKPKALSGGQRQRVAMGRAIVRRPKVFLFDEPLSNLDASLRAQMRMEISRLHAELGITTIYVTHDQVEAMTLADRIVILHDGVLQQVGPPMEVYEQPANAFVAGFLGSPPMNILHGQMAENQVFQCKELKIPIKTTSNIQVNQSLFIGIRPQKLVLDEHGPICGQVELVEPMGSETIVRLRLEGEQKLCVRLLEQTNIRRGDKLGLSAEKQHIHIFEDCDGQAGVTLS